MDRGNRQLLHDSHKHNTSTDSSKTQFDLLKLPREIRDGYKIIGSAGEGTYGKVYLAQNNQNKQEIVAIKVLSLSRRSDGIPATTVKEVSLLKDLKHENVVELRAVSLNSECFALIFEACETDLGHVLDLKIRKEAYMSRRVVRDLMYQLLRAIAYVHQEGILHRDIKPQNILLTENETRVKLADFGLACVTDLSVPHEQKNCSAITLWYRPPELLLGHCGYSRAADLWSIGCVFAEMLVTRTVLNAPSEVGQLRRIFGLMRIPPNLTAIFPEVERLPFLADVINKQGARLENLLPVVLDQWTIDLLMRMLEINPDNRITAEQALLHPYFTDPNAAAHIWSFRPTVIPSQFESSVNQALPKLRPHSVPQTVPTTDALYRSELNRISKASQIQFSLATTASLNNL